MAPSSHHAIRVIEESRVSPPPGLVPETSLPLTFFDALWLYADQVQRIFFYPFPHSTTHFIDSVLPTLKSSLSLSLQHFYPLAGHLRLSPGSDDQFEIYYTDGDAVAITVAECSGDFQGLSGGHIRELDKLRPLVPQLANSNDMRPLLTLQVTVFPNHGISIGVAVPYVACDGSSSMHFIKSWAASCQSGGSVSLVGPPPSYDREVIADPRGLYSSYISSWRKLKANQPQDSTDDNPRADMVLGSFKLSREQIDMLRQRVQAKPREGKASFHCSTFVLTYAYVWVCLARVRGCTSNRSAYLVLSLDCRARLHPPAPPSYFGNCIGGCYIKAKADDLGAEDGVVVAAELIGRAIKGLENGALDGAEAWMTAFTDLATEWLMSGAGSPQLRVYDTDFGWGRPVKVDVVSIENTGAMSLAQSRDGQGGIEIGLALPKAEMDAFGVHFAKPLFSRWIRE